MTKERKDQYITLLVICAGLLFFSVKVVKSPLHIEWRHQYLAVASAVILLTGLVSAFMLQKIAAAWLWIGEKMGAVMSRVILSFVFLFVLTPISLLYRAFGRKAKEKKASYFVERNHKYSAADLEKIF